MINKITIWVDKPDDKLNQTYNSFASWEQYELEHLKSEPHAFLLIGFLAVY